MMKINPYVQISVATVIMIAVIIGTVKSIESYHESKQQPYTKSWIEQDTPKEGYTSVYLEGETAPSVYKNTRTISWGEVVSTPKYNAQVREQLKGFEKLVAEANGMSAEAYIEKQMDELCTKMKELNSSKDCECK